MFREVMKWISGVFLGNTILFWNLDCISKNKFICRKDESFDINRKNILDNLYN
jgi:hypothetical protein